MEFQNKDEAIVQCDIVTTGPKIEFPVIQDPCMVGLWFPAHFLSSKVEILP